MKKNYKSKIVKTEYLEMQSKKYYIKVKMQK